MVDMLRGSHSSEEESIHCSTVNRESTYSMICML